MILLFGQEVLFAEPTQAKSARVTLHLQNESIANVFEAIERQTVYSFIYDSGAVDVNHRVNVDADNMLLTEVLDIVFRNTGIVYTLRNEQIIISREARPRAAAQEPQGRSVSGTIMDEAGNPLPGVTVTIVGTVRGAVTDEQGSYTIEVSGSQDVLEVRYIGYLTSQIAVGTSASVDVVLRADVQRVEDVVVIGYGTVRKKDLTSAIAVVDTESMSKAPTTSTMDALQGHIPGLEVSMNSRPGEDAFVNIRGINSFSNINPLYVIDGMPTTSGLRDFNPADVESIQVLKDASAASIYGSRAANGVIIITTKKGQAGAAKVNFSASSSWQMYRPTYEFAGTDEWIDIITIAKDNAKIYDPGASILYPDREKAKYDTDWWDAVSGTGTIQQYQVSVSGGSDVGNYYVSSEYFTNKGVIYGSSYDRINFRVNTNGKKGIFSFGQTLLLSNNVQNPTALNSLDWMMAMSPMVPVYDPENVGGYGYGKESQGNHSMGENPVAAENLLEQKRQNFRIRGAIWGEAAIMPELKYRLNVGYEMNFTHDKDLRKLGAWRLNQAAEQPFIRESWGRSDSPLIEHTLTYDKRFKRHSLTAMVGYTYQSQTRPEITARSQGLTQSSLGEYFDQFDTASTPMTITGNTAKEAMISYLGRVAYSFDDKYLLTATFRRDGTSKVRKDSRWGNFPSLSVAWRITSEKFMAGTRNWLDDLKLKVSYGELGGMNIGNWQYMPLINANSTAIFGPGQTAYDGGIQVALVNEDLRWERQTQTNFGFDATLLNNRLSVSADYFISKAFDLLLGLPIPRTSGHPGNAPVVNAADMENRGFEFALGWREKRGDFDYYANASITTGRNKVTNLGYDGNSVSGNASRTEVGRSIGEFYLIEALGKFKTDEEAQAYKNSAGRIIQPQAKAGDLKYLDLNDDGQITDADRKYVGSPHSDVQIGLNMGVTWKNLDFQMNWFADLGGMVYSDTRRFLGSGDGAESMKLHLENYWTPDNPNAEYPRLIADKTDNGRGSTFWLENGSWAKLKSLTIGYNLPAEWLGKIGIEQCRFYFTGQNLLTFTNLKLVDPEYRKDNITAKGFRGRNAFPNPLTLNVGVQLQF